MPSSKRPEKLVVDANPILSALLGGQARRIFFETSIEEFAVPEVVLGEVRAHLPHVSRKVGVATAFLDYALGLLPLRPYSPGAYRGTMSDARRRIGRRDPHDVDVLALTLHLGWPLWTNDRDFEGTRVECVTTARLLSLFFPPGS